MLSVATLCLVSLAAAPKFQPYDAKEDGFSIGFPGAPKFETETEKDDSGPMVTHSYTVEKGDAVWTVNVVQSALFAQATDEKTIAAILDGFRDSMTKGMKQLSSKRLTLGGANGLEVHGRDKDKETISRVYLLGPRIFVITVLWASTMKAEAVGGQAFVETFALTQAKSAPAPSAKPPPSAPEGDPTSSAVFAIGEKEKLEPAAASAAEAWAVAIVEQDGQWLDENFPKDGVQAGKKTLKRAQLREGFEDLTGLRPGFGCENAKTSTDCKWSFWRVEVKGKSEFWLYNTDDSFYGPWRSMVFKKKGGAWKWTAMADLDGGEP